MRKNLEELINVSKPKNCDASLPFIFTTVSGERKIVWFLFSGNIMSEPCDITVSKIFMLDNNNSIETFDVDIKTKIMIGSIKMPSVTRSEYIKKFNEQFETNQFDDVMEFLSSAEYVALLDVYESVIDYLKKPRIVVCQHCGKSVGFFTKLTGVQYYTPNGEDDGYTVDAQNDSVYCRYCKKRVCNLAEFKKRSSHGY